MLRCIICDSTDWRDFYKIHDFKLLRCQRCGLVSRFPLPTREELANLYNKEYFMSKRPVEVGYRDYLEMKGAFDKRFRHYLELVKRYKGTGRILDFGCALGFFMELAKNNGWEPYGVDLSSYACDYGKRVLGLNMFSGFLEEAHFPDEFFDVATLWDILEHLLNPKEDLEEINKVLKNGGYLFVTVPHVDNCMRKLMGKRWFGFNKIKEHLYFFSPQTIRFLLEKTGFECIKIETVPWRSTLDFLVEKIGRYNNTLQKILGSMLKKAGMNNLEIDINFMVFLTIAQKK